MTKVFLSAGHGGSDPGAVGNGLQEKAINLAIMLACAAKLRKNGYEVVCSRTRDENDPVQEEVREANASGAAVAVSFHTNAGGGDGSESFYYAGSANGKRLAQLCEKHVQEIGQNSRGIKTNNLMFTRSTKMTAVLCECAFIDNKTDVSIIDTEPEQAAFGVAYAKAIIEYFGGSVTPSKPVSSGSNTSTSDKIEVDGDWGKATTTLAQMVFGTPIDGIVSNQDPKYKPNLIACGFGSWDFEGTGNGSNLIAAIQEWLGVKADGFMGVKTIEALQAKLGVKVDGILGELTCKAFQTWLNSQVA